VARSAGAPADESTQDVHHAIAATFACRREGTIQDRVGGILVCAPPPEDLLHYRRDLIRSFRHLLVALVGPIVRERLAAEGAQVPVAEEVERDVWRRRQKQRIEMRVLAPRLPLAMASQSRRCRERANSSSWQRFP
jgi:hypothetical protein